MKIAIAGGGAAGFFAAITCAETFPAAEVTLLEKSPELLAKVTISGGGRCNVTHACFDPLELVKRYPRGHRELLGAFHRWQPRDTVEWFESRGVKLKTEADGRMFPATDKSTTITDCLKEAAREFGVRTRTRCGLATARKGEVFHLTLTNGEEMDVERLMLATGGNQNSSGFALASSLGHTIEAPVPSLFTFEIDDERLKGRQGLSVSDAEASVPELKLAQRGPVLVTHWGLSGPAILKLSAWGARALHDAGYTFELKMNWRPGLSLETMSGFRQAHAKRGVAASSPFPEIPGRLWAALAGNVSDVWATMSKEAMRALHQRLTDCRFRVTGKSLFKDEFVTCGGVRLSEVDFRTMESRRCKGLYFGGEILDIDGVTGGFNLQSAWTTGWIAGKVMGQEVG